MACDVHSCTSRSRNAQISNRSEVRSSHRFRALALGHRHQGHGSKYHRTKQHRSPAQAHQGHQILPCGVHLSERQICDQQSHASDRKIASQDQGTSSCSPSRSAGHLPGSHGLKSQHGVLKRSRKFLPRFFFSLIFLFQFFFSRLVRS